MKMKKKDTTILSAKGLLPLQASKLREILNGNCELRGVDPEWSFCDVVPTNCSQVRQGSLFIPLRETNEVCADKVRRGALAVLTDRNLPGIPTILVPDLGEALGRICAWMYEAIDLPAVVVTGSTGKTSTKRMINSVLRTRKRVYSELENNNTLYDFGVSLQRMDEGNEMIVQEVDESRRNNAFWFSKVLKPRIAVVTNIAESHMGHVGSKENLIRNFEAIASGMREDGIVIINGDDPDSLRANFCRRIIRVGIRDQSCECTAQNIRSRPGGTTFDLCYQGKRIAIRLRVLGEHNVYNAMMAYLVGKLSGMKDRDILRGLAGFRNMGIRQNILKLYGVTVYADCYNASLRSITYALKCFCELKIGRGKRVAILGDIGEIEGFEEETYRQIAALLDNSPMDAVITYGKDIKRVGDYMTGDLTWHHAESFGALVGILDQHKKEYRAFLFKASRMMRLEECIQQVFPKHYRVMRFQEKVALKREKMELRTLLATLYVLWDFAKRVLRRKKKG